MIDKGGLDYTIKVRDEFTRAIKRFRAQVQAARQELGSLRSAQAAVNRTRQQANQAADQADKAQLERIRAIQAGVREQQRVEALRARILKAQQREASQAARQEISLFRQRAAAQDRATAAAQREAAAQARAAQARGKSASVFDRITKAADGTTGAVNRVSFSFRRLIGIFAVFQAARAGANLFTGLVRDSINYSRTLEDSQISLASLFSTIGEIRDSQGELVTGAEAFGAGMEVAAEQTRKLQAEAVNTVATFEELLRAFQAGVGPGLEAGLNLDQIRQVTVQVSQAAAALSIPQNQLIEEIRSLLRGTIQARTTIVASVLGITNEDIRQAKEAGNLFEFLQSRLAGFSLAAQATQRTLTGLGARVVDAFQIAGGAASVDLFDQLKISLEELGDAFLQFERDADGKITNVLPRQEAVLALTGLFEGLGNAVTILREGFQQVDFGTVGVVLGGLGSVFEGLAAAAAGFARGFVDSLAGTIGILSSIVGQLDEGNGILYYVEAIFEFLGQWSAPVLVAAAAMAALRGSLFLISPLATVISRAFQITRIAVVGIFNAIRLIPGPALGIVGALAGAAVAAELFAEKLLGAKGSLLDIGELAGLAFEQSFTELFGFIDEIYTRVSVAIRNAFDSAATAAKIAIREIKAVFDLQLGASREIAQLAADEKARANQDDRIRLAQAQKQRELEINEVIKERDRIQAFAAERAKQRLLDLQAEVDNRTDDPVFARITAAFSSLGQLTGVNFDEISTQIADGTIDPEKIAERMQEAIERFTVQGRQSLEEGSGAGPLEKYLQGIVDNFASGLTIMRGLVQSFSSFVSDSITGALDPNNDKSLKQRFGEFLQDIAKLIIDQLVQVAIAKAVLGLTSSDTAGADAATGALGRAEGGPIPGGHAAPRRIRPKGLDPRDTTPIWAQPGEFMVRKSIVDQPAVAEFLERLNAGMISPSSLQALMGRSARRRLAGISRKGPPGYAEGGIIQQAASTVDRAADRNNTQEQRPVMAAVVANDQTFEKLLNGGGQAFRRYLQDNAAEIDGILRTGRTGG